MAATKSARSGIVDIEYNTSGQPTGTCYIAGSKYTFTATGWTVSIQGQPINIDATQATKINVAYPFFSNNPYDGAIDVIRPDGGVVTLTLTLATGQDPGVVQ